MTLILSRSDVVDLLSLPECIDAVERAFRLHAEGRTLGPGVLGVPASGGGFHIKAAGLVGERSYFFATKTNANFSDNPRRWGPPTIQGTIVLADAANGTPLAIMDSGSVTALRTGAATAVAATFLARPTHARRPSWAATFRANSSSPRSRPCFPCDTSCSSSDVRSVASGRVRRRQWSRSGPSRCSRSSSGRFAGSGPRVRYGAHGCSRTATAGPSTSRICASVSGGQRFGERSSARARCTRHGTRSPRSCWS